MMRAGPQVPVGSTTAGCGHRLAISCTLTHAVRNSFGKVRHLNDGAFALKRVVPWPPHNVPISVCWCPLVLQEYSVLNDTVG